MLDKILGIKDVVADVTGKISSTIDNLHTSEKEKLEANAMLKRLENELIFKTIDAAQKEVESQRDIIVAEAKSESWIARNWRPITALVFTYIIAHNYVIGPLFSLRILEIPPDMWQLLKLMIGGYVASRGIEKGIKEWKL